MLTLTLIPILCVAAGGAIGALLRFAAIQLTMHFHPAPFPLGTMIVNILGSFVIGFLMVRYITTPSESGQLFFVTGVLGGFTTFSAFSWDALQLMQRGQLTLAATYILGSVVLSLGAVMLGYQMGR